MKHTKLILAICSAVNVALGYASLVTATPEEAIFYVLTAIWILILTLTIK